MNELIQSKALEANLSETKKVEYTIPEEHQWLISLSEKYWGIHNRAMEFFKEFHHPYSNRKDVIKLLVNVAISDFRIYKELEERDRVIHIFLQIFDKLLSENLSEALSKHLVYKYLDFFSLHFDSLNEFPHLTLEYIDILDRHLETNQLSYISNIGYFQQS